MTAVELFRPNTPPPAVTLTGDGEVAFTWHRNGIEAGLIIDGERADIWIRNPATGEEWASAIELHRSCCAERILDAVAGKHAARSLVLVGA